MCLKLVFFILLYLFQKSNQYGKKSDIIFRKLNQIEIYENIQIGYLLIDLKSNLIDTNEIDYEKWHFVFEFIDKDKYSDVLNSIALRNYFLLDEISGTIKTSKSIDVENFCDLNLCQNNKDQNEIYYLNKSLKEGCLINFKIKATRTSNTNKENQIYHISFDLIIHDINEFNPEFSQKGPLSFNVNEEFSPIKLLLGSVPYDNDCTDKSQIYYMIKIINVTYTQNPHDFHNLDFYVIPEQDLLFLYTNKSFDREIFQKIELDIIAYDRLNITISNKAILKIILNITDINDNAPKFERSNYNLEFDEGLLPGTELIRLKATDPDQGQNGLVRYELAGLTDDIKETFHLNHSTGALFLKKKLNSGRKKWTLHIRASDYGLNTKSSTCLVNILVNDINNNKPEISLNLFVIPKLIEPKFVTTRIWDKNTIIKEDIIYLSRDVDANTTIGIVNVIDRDSGSNGQIENCEIFLLDSENQEIPVYLQSFNEIDLKTSYFSTDSNLNKDIKSLVENELKSFRLQKNEQKYFIRTKASLENFTRLNLELRSSDRGNLNKQTGQKIFKIIILNNQYDLDDDVSEDNFEDEEFDDLDEEMTQYKTNRLILKINITENNDVPIDLARITPADFDLNSILKYELILPSFVYLSDINSTTNRAKTSKCSIDLIKYLTIEELNGVVKLNKSLDRELCPFYKFFIRATNLQDKRIVELLTFKINVLDQDDNPPKFEQAHYTFEVIENLNKTLPVKVLDSDIKSNYIFRLESLNDENKLDNLNEIFLLDKSSNSKQINIVMKKNIEYKTRNRYIFNLVVIEINEFDQGIVNSDTTLIEILVLSEKDLKPNIKKLDILGDLVTKNSSSCKKLNDENFYVQTNLDHLLNKLKIKEPFKARAYLNVLQIDVGPENERLRPRKAESIHFYIQSLEFYETINNFKNKTKFLFPSNMDSSDLFLLNESDGILNIDLTSFNQLHSKVQTPFVCLIGIKAKNISNELSTNFLIILSLNSEKTPPIEHLRLENYLNEIYPAYTRSIITIEKSNSTKQSFLKENFKSIRNVLINTHFPLLILTIIIIFLLIVLIVLFIISIIYSLTICRIFECGNKKFYENELKVNDTCQSSLINHEIVTNQKTHGWLRFKISKLFNNENKTKLSCPNVCLNSIEKTNSKFVQKNDQSDYLLDSPILVRKIYETNDEETKEKYLKKYHLEYLFDNTKTNKVPVEDVVEKKPKRISFKCNKGQSEESKIKDSSSSYEDDDFIIPNNATNYVNKFKNDISYYTNQETFNNTLLNQLNSSYIKSPIQPDDVVWIKKLNSNQLANSGLNFNKNNKEIVL